MISQLINFNLSSVDGRVVIAQMIHKVPGYCNHLAEATESPAYLPGWGATPLPNGYCIEQVARLRASASDCMVQYIRTWTKSNKKLFYVRLT